MITNIFAMLHHFCGFTAIENLVSTCNPIICQLGHRKASFSKHCTTAVTISFFLKIATCTHIPVYQSLHKECRSRPDNRRPRRSPQRSGSHRNRSPGWFGGQSDRCLPGWSLNKPTGVCRSSDAYSNCSAETKVIGWVTITILRHW